MKADLINRLIETGAITFGGAFLSKSGRSFSYETDLRNAFMTWDSALLTARQTIVAGDLLAGEFDYFIGVPETGTLIASFLNQEKRRLTGKDCPVNQLRAAPKLYQHSTNSVHTVLPLNCSDRVILVEDDVVSGATMLKYLKMALEAGLQVIRVVAVIDRELPDEQGRTVRQRVEEEFSVPYQAVVTLNEILAYMGEVRT